VPHLSQRDKIYLFPEVFNAKYILLDCDSGFYPIKDPKVYAAEMLKLIKKDDFGIVYSSGSTILFQKGAANQTLPSEKILEFLKNNK